MNEPSDWDHYRSFLAVLTEGSLSAAARMLGLTQPTVGRHIRALEQTIGSVLFLRSPQGLVPTETALAIRPYAETMAATAAALMRTATASGSSPRGSVRISCSEAMGIEVLPPILTGLKQRYPDLEIELSLSDEVEDLLKQEADIAVRMVAPTQDALVSRRIGAIPIALYAHCRYLERHGMPLSLADLTGHSLIGYDRRLPYVRATLKDRPDLSALDFGIRSDSNLAQLAMIRAGAGIGLCQAPLGRRDPDLVEVLPGSLDLSLETFTVMHENVKATPRCRVTFDALVEGLLTYLSSASENR